MKTITSLLTERLGMFRTWGSFGRVTAWAVVWTVVISAVVAPAALDHTGREHVADIPASDVRYVGPISRTDFSGFLPPADSPDTFRLAWIGGSEVKLREVSVPGEFSQRVSTVGGAQLVIDSYNVIAPRWIEALRAVDTASTAGVDAIVIALNPAWIRSEWSMRGWPNTDVSNIGTLWSRRSTWSWAFALTSPSDAAWRLARAAFPIVEAQHEYNDDARDLVDALNIVERPDDLAPVERGDPRLPTNATAFWLVNEYGPDALTDEDTRVAAIMAGIGVDQAEAEFFAHLLVDTVSELDVPVLMYATPFSAESLAKPEFAARTDEVEQFWQAIAGDIDDPSVELIPRSQTDDFPQPGQFLNNVHMATPGPFADILVERLCAQWAAAGLECA